jgi:phosphopantothenoylcysteine decarboxylase / phosphopantothenate---cysteine ligase
MRVLLGVSGGIAAYKAAGIVRALIKRGDEVRVVMTHGAQEFITPMTLQVLSNHPVSTELFDPTHESEIGHIELARWPDVILLAPATAQLIAKAAHGLADDLLTTVLLATTAPVVFAPAMNTQMYRNALVQANIARLVQVAGWTAVTPDAGFLACKEVGEGRLPDPPVLLDVLDRVMSPKPLAGQRVVISAGPTREHIDPARFISNPSTGKMGCALAQAAWLLGAQVELVLGPTGVEPPANVAVRRVTSAEQMAEAVWGMAPQADVVVMTAAVADWRPAQSSEQKRAKSDMTGQLDLVRNPDILARLGELYGPGKGSGPLLVGFAAESHDVEERGHAKLARKNAHLLVANKIGGADSAFGADASSATVFYHADERPNVRLGLASKDALARQIWEAILPALSARVGGER